jgi:segregation and condensation protein B
MSLNPEQLKNIIEAALLAAGQPLSIDRLQALFAEEIPDRDEIRAALNSLSEECMNRGVELKEVSSGFRFQARKEYASWLARLWEEKPTRYSRALLETLALIAYRQPITRGEIEDIRGVGVTTHIMKTLQEREWVRVVGHRDVPGKPAMYATTREFLDYFSLKGLDELPSLAEIKDLDSINAELEFGDPDMQIPAPLSASNDEFETDETEPDDEDLSTPDITDEEFEELVDELDDVDEDDQDEAVPARITH